MYKKYIVVFGTDDYKGTIELLLRSVEKMVDGIFVYSDDNIDNEFYSKNKKILSQPRGSGYWMWKPYFILETFKKMNAGDVCLYLDSGVIAIDDIGILFEICKSTGGILLFENRCGNKNGDVWKNITWTKKDCFNLMNCNTEKYIHGNQVEASFQLYEKNNKSCDLLNEYLKYCQNENIVTDLSSITEKEDPEFIEHRHDQSIISLLAIQYSVNIERSPTQWTEHLITNNSKYKTLFYQHKQKMELCHTVPINLNPLYYKYKVV